MLNGLGPRPTHHIPSHRVMPAAQAPSHDCREEQQNICTVVRSSRDFWDIGAVHAPACISQAAVVVLIIGGTPTFESWKWT